MFLVSLASGIASAIGLTIGVPTGIAIGVGVVATRAIRARRLAKEQAA